MPTCWYVWGHNPEFPTVPHGCPPHTFIFFIWSGYLLKKTRFLAFRDIGKDLVSGNGHTFPIIQPGGRTLLLGTTGTNRRTGSGKVL